MSDSTTIENLDSISHVMQTLEQHEEVLCGPDETHFESNKNSLNTHTDLEKEQKSGDIIASLEKVIDTKLVEDEKGTVRYYRVQWSTWINEENLKKNYDTLIMEYWKEQEEETKRAEIRIMRQKREEQASSKRKRKTEAKRAVKEQQKRLRLLSEQLANKELSITTTTKLVSVNSDISESTGGTETATSSQAEVGDPGPSFSSAEIEKEDHYRLQLETEDDVESKDGEHGESDESKGEDTSGDGKLKLGRAVTCKQCGVSFNNSYYKDKCRFCTNTCRECGKQFKRPSALRNHIEGVHEKNKKHRCELCGKLFTTRHYLTNHILKHKPDRNYECDVCHKRYKDLTKLKRHRLIHTGIKPFKCQVCQREFQQNEALKKHMLLHTDGPRRFQCLLCKKGFNHKVSLKSHMLKHHDKNEQQAAVMIGLWKKYQQTEAAFDSMVPNTDVLSKALNDVVMVPHDTSAGGMVSTTSSNTPNFRPTEHEVNSSLSMLNFSQPLNLP